MNQYRTYTGLDDQTAPVGDTQFLGLNMRDDPVTLPPGIVSRSENMRFETTGAQARAGVARQLSAGDTVELINCAGVYRPENSNDRIALVNTTRLTLFNPVLQTTVRYDFPVGETVEPTDDPEIIQGGVSSGTLPDLYIGRGYDKDVLKFDGTTVTVDASFRRFSAGIFTQDRMGVISSRQDMAASDLLDFTVWSQLSQFQILKGGDDYLLHVREFQKDFVLIGARKKWFIAHFNPTISPTLGYGYTGNVTDDSFLRVLTRETGIIGKRAANESNGKIWTVTDRAIHAFVPRLDLELTVLGTPISAPIQPIMDRMSVEFAKFSSIKHSGHRQYFALPINGPLIRIISVAVGPLTPDLELPFDLPAVLGNSGTALFTTKEPHDLKVGDIVRITGAVDASLNRTAIVLTTPTATSFTIDVLDFDAGGLGQRASMQKVATRPNAILVWNFALPRQALQPDAPDGAWESIDFLPSELFADFLVVADAPAGQRRLWLVDADLGPCLYEEGDTDEIFDTIGGLDLAFDLPVDLSVANFGSAPVAGRVLSRTYQWGGIPRHIRAGSSRLTLDTGDSGTMTLRVRTPGWPEWSTSKSFNGLLETDHDKSVRTRCGRRALEAELEINCTGGRPAVRQLMLEVMNSGRDKEE